MPRPRDEGLPAVSYGSASRPERRGLGVVRLALSASALAFLLGACGLFEGPTPKPPPTPLPPGAVTLGVSVDRPVNAASFTLTYPSAATYLKLPDQSAAAGVLVRAYDDGKGHVTIALVSHDPVKGTLFEVAFDGSDGSDIGTASVETYVLPHDPAGAKVALDVLNTTSVTTSNLLQGEGWADAIVAGVPSTQVPPLDASWAKFALGDLDKSGSVDVLDVLRDLDIGSGASATAYEEYAGDLVPDDDIGSNDVLQLLDKAVDPGLPAQAVIKPLGQPTLSYVALAQGVPILVGNSGNQALGSVTFTASGVHGTASQPGTAGKTVAGQTALYTFGDPNDDFGELSVSAGGADATFLVGNLVILVAGQSNAEGRGEPLMPQTPAPVPEVRMLGNDYVWKEAHEPLDDGTNQVDMVSYDNAAAQSFGTSLGTTLRSAVDRFVYLIPSARGGTKLRWESNGYKGWDPTVLSDRTDPSASLFGSAAYRGLVSAGLEPMPNGVSNPIDAEGGPVRVVAWYQGESDSRTAGERSNYVPYTKNVFDGFIGGSGVFASDGTVIFAQLAGFGHNPGDAPGLGATKNLQNADIAERQRELESGAWHGTPALDPASSISPYAKAFMVVTHDLPMSEDVHLSAAGQNELGRRIALAVEEHVLGMNIDGTGPRVTGITHSGNVVTLTTDVQIDAPTTTSDAAYEGYFTVYDGPPDPLDVDDSAVYGANNRLAIAQIQRGSDKKSIVITLGASPSGSPYVRYARPEFTCASASACDAPRLDHVVRASGSSLPLPSFGPLAAN